ncbi:MAG: hypothetical protein F6J93_30790 [Oscillatoria sp. SIO1A7]|nr:hypothetical protein [Oscillatoria sp. SIO1A7]
MGCRVWGVGCGVWDVGCGVWGVGCGVGCGTRISRISQLPPDAYRRKPRLRSRLARLRKQSPERANLYKIEMLQCPMPNAQCPMPTRLALIILFYFKYYVFRWVAHSYRL